MGFGGCASWGTPEFDSCYSLDSGIRSATIVSGNGLPGDPLSTACFFEVGKGFGIGEK